ncbi:hypothetical protein M440DRAFT_188478 [Trichoderma longibrachiatum ATCC 18648]|uniref:Uncharacterized protein n=1 Tax=Trichoderma longibrachiatum ATCC 18648 TaxID=983965 RepID=A0A2T4CFB0_TRILO|nr:hypothetical protein M440DRAFT_188478 [Trichoderma longibrachiatum ATCC 18648]
MVECSVQARRGLEMGSRYYRQKALPPSFDLRGFWDDLWHSVLPRPCSNCLPRPATGGHQTLRSFRKVWLFATPSVAQEEQVIARLAPAQPTKPQSSVSKPKPRKPSKPSQASPSSCGTQQRWLAHGG